MGVHTKEFLGVLTELRTLDINQFEYQRMQRGIDRGNMSKTWNRERPYTSPHGACLIDMRSETKDGSSARPSRNFKGALHQRQRHHQERQVFNLIGAPRFEHCRSLNIGSLWTSSSKPKEFGTQGACYTQV